MTDKVKSVFRATFPAIQTALKVDGSGGMRIQLDIPEIEMGEAVKLLLLRQCVLRVTIEADEQSQENQAAAQPIKRSAAKRRI